MQVTPVLCDGVARWQEVVPVATALRNPVMQDRHWTKLQQELVVMLPLGPAFTLQTLFDLKVTCHAHRHLAAAAAPVRAGGLACLLNSVQTISYTCSDSDNMVMMIVTTGLMATGCTAGTL